VGLEQKRYPVTSTLETNNSKVNNLFLVTWHEGGEEKYNIGEATMTIA